MWRLKPPEEEEELLCLPQHCVCVSSPGQILSDVDSEKPEGADSLHWGPGDGDGDGGVFSLLPPELLLQLLGFAGGLPDSIGWECAPRLCRPDHHYG